MQYIVFEIDGKSISTLEDFCEQMWPLLTNTQSEGTTNLDALNDILSWPTSVYTLVWKNSQLSKSTLGYAEMVRKLSSLSQRCHPSNLKDFESRIQRALRGEGPTMFDWLVEIIQANERYVTLKLD